MFIIGGHSFVDEEATVMKWGEGGGESFTADQERKEGAQGYNVMKTRIWVEKKRPEPSDHICSGCTVVHLANECRVIALIMSHWRPCFVKILKTDHFGKGIGHTTADLISTRAPSTRRYGLPVALSCACYSTFFWRPQNQPSRTNN